MDKGGDYVIDITRWTAALHDVVDYQLPYTLHRRFFTFFRQYTKALIPLAALGGVIGGTLLFLVVLIVGGVLWLAFGLCALMARDSITVYDDRLVFDLSGKQYSTFYSDLRWVDVAVDQTSTYRSRHHLWIAWDGVEDRPLYLDLERFGRKDQRFLMRTIAARAPHAMLNDPAKELATIRRG